jgi:CO/xanthine dehydrogenase Mo-binding subunit
LAQRLGIERTDIRIHQQDIGGGFGRKLDEDTELEAALIARDAGRPIKLIRSREEDFQRGFYRPLTLQALRAGLDGSGRIVAWEHLYVGASAPARRLRLAPSAPDPRGLSGSDHYYDIPNQRLRVIRTEQGVPAGSYRGVDSGYAGFAVETFIDELAHSLKADPLAFRLGLLSKQARLTNVLRIVAARSGWGTPLPPGTGRGLAVAPAWRLGQTWMAVVVQARVERSSGQVRVEKITCALDCGLVVNPDGVRAQTEGALLFGLSTALKERGSVANGAFEQKNFDEYEILRMDEVPEVELHVVESTERPTGVGEPGTAAVAPALGNAIFAATGARVRRLPMLPERVLDALKEKRG